MPNIGKFQLITEADFVLSRCGRFVPPVGSIVYIPKSFLLQAALPIGANQVFYKSITGDTMWTWRSVSFALSASPPQISAQILKPDGKFLFNGLLDLTQVAGYGSNKYLLSRAIDIPPGSKLQLTLDDTYLGSLANTPTVQPVSLLCGGAYAYYLKDGIRSRCTEDEASALPRIFSGSNQNLLAPSWMWGEYEKVPEGFEVDAFTYGNGESNVVALTAAAPVSSQVSIQIDNDNDFLLRRFLFDIRSSGGSTGTVLARIRAGSGYIFTDDFLDVAKYLGGVYFAKAWKIQRGDQIHFDLSLVNGAGGGAITIECFADGVKLRRKVAAA